MLHYPLAVGTSQQEERASDLSVKCVKLEVISGKNKFKFKGQ